MADMILSNIDFHFAPFKGGVWKTYRYLDGLASDVVLAIYCDPDGTMWFGTPDIVFMDIRMPIMDGLEATQKIWEEFGRDALKIVAVSASTLVHEQEKYLSFGFNAFLSKPFHTEQIYQCLASLLQLEYQYEAVDASHIPLVLSQLTLPEELRIRLKEAAECYSASNLEIAIDEVAQLSAEGHQ